MPAPGGQAPPTDAPQAPPMPNVGAAVENAGQQFSPADAMRGPPQPMPGHTSLDKAPEQPQGGFAPPQQNPFQGQSAQLVARPYSVPVKDGIIGGQPAPPQSSAPAAAATSATPAQGQPFGSFGQQAFPNMSDPRKRGGFAR